MGSIVCIHELALTSSIYCSCHFAGALARDMVTHGCPSRSTIAWWLARGQATLALLRLNCHRSMNSGELLVLTRYPYHPDRTLGRRNSRAATADSRSPLQLMIVHL